MVKRSLSIFALILGVGLTGSLMAAGYQAKSAVNGDDCHMKATPTTMTDASGNKMAGVLFEASYADGDRLDIHCKKVTVKLGQGIDEVFVVGLAESDLSHCFFHEHAAGAGMDHEGHLKTKAKLTKS